MKIKYVNTTLLHGETIMKTEEQYYKTSHDSHPAQTSAIGKKFKYLYLIADTNLLDDFVKQDLITQGNYHD